MAPKRLRKRLHRLRITSLGYLRPVCSSRDEALKAVRR